MKPLVKILSTVVSLVAGIVGSKVLDSTWKQVTGQDAPKKKNKEAREDQSVVRVATFAAISAATAALIKIATERGANKLVNRTKSRPEEV
ncbi:DUF4235 domain-containing protein [Galactobacter caseinivorans]|uniref:DUF4235 domain-containing protein n=1 Tax=Galactobacter caseinivorans TaxID=2676123 RepID=A0A496PIB9_9MICC|nr:DUF4235 domain-containing protein [Galactobacter caseinivorans]RKW70246.1 DUF4235 domain-containing protein [Galactobacter caseinivorans]